MFSLGVGFNLKSTIISNDLAALRVQVVVTAPGHQTVNLIPLGASSPPVPNKVGVICKLQRFDGLVCGGAAVGVQGG